MDRLGNVNISGLDLSPTMRNDLAAGMSASDFNSKYSSSVAGFRPISLARQMAAAPAAAPAATAVAPPPAAAPAGPNPDDIARQQLEQEVSGIFGELGTATANMKSPVDVYNESMEKLGLADARTRVVSLREQLMNTENLLRNVETDVSGRTQDSNVTEGQRRRLVASEQQPLAGQVDIFGRALEGAMADYGMVQGEGKTQAELTFQGDKEKRTAIMDRLQVAIDRSKSAEDKRRWETELTRLRQQDAEATRQFNEKLALDKTKFEGEMSLEQQKLADARAGAARTSASGGSSSTSAKASQVAAQQQVSQYILGSNVRGKDGYIGPGTYRQLKSEWVDAGWPASSFDGAFRQYANPTHLKDYGL